MRLVVFNCLLLASVAVALSDGRHKRNLAFLKNVITSPIFGRSQINILAEPEQEENGYKLFGLPGYDDVIIQVASKKPMVEEFVYPPDVETINLNAFGTVVGTQSKDDTLVAVNEVETEPVLTEEVETRPVLTEVVETRPVFTEVIGPVEEKAELIVPFEPKYSYKQIQNNEPVMTYTAHYNPGVKLVETVKTKTELPMCIKKRVDEAILLGADPNRLAPVQEIFQYQNPPVVDFSYPIVEANAFVQNSFREEVAPVQEVFQYQRPPVVDFSYPREEAYAFVQNSFREEVAPVQEVFKYQSPPVVDFSYPRVDANAFVQNSFCEEVAPVQEVFQYQSPPVVDFSYPRVEANAYLQNTFREEVAPVQEVHQFQSPSLVDFSYPGVEANAYVQNSFRKELKKESDVTNGFGLTSQRLRPSKDSPVRYNLRPTMTKAINPHPYPLHSQKSLHIEEENISASKDKVNPPTRKVQAFNNLGEKDVSQTLGPYIARVNNERLNSEVLNGNRNQIKTVPIAGSNISNTKIPVNVYKLQSNPNIGNVVKESDALRTNGKPNTNQYDNGPALNSGTARKDTAQIKNVVHSNKVAAKPQSVTRPVVVASKNAPKQPLRENIETSIIHKPTAVKDNKNYYYQHINANDSSLNVNSNKYGVSVIVKENNNSGRGDIPDQ